MKGSCLTSEVREARLPIMVGQQSMIPAVCVQHGIKVKHAAVRDA
jgi:hypothetical protein